MKLKDVLILAADHNDVAKEEAERNWRLFFSIVFRRASQVSFVNGEKVDLMSLANVVEQLL